MITFTLIFLRNLTFCILALCLALGAAWTVLTHPVVFGAFLVLVLAFRWSVEDYNND